MPISLHVICKPDPPGSIHLKGLTLIDAKNYIYESVSWPFKEEFVPALIGKTFCMHDTKAGTSYMGGTIIRIDRRPIADNDGEVRNVVIFQATKEARGFKWPHTHNPNEYCQVNTDTPLNSLRSS